MLQYKMVESNALNKKCNACGGAIRPVNEFFFLVCGGTPEAYEEFKNKFKEQSGMDFKESSNSNCIECGMLYGEEGNCLGVAVEWFLKMKEVYEIWKERLGIK